MTIKEIKAAFQGVHKRACGDTSEVYMSIPPCPKRDADIIVYDAIDELGTLRERVKGLEAERGIARQLLGEMVAMDETGGPGAMAMAFRRLVAFLNIPSAGDSGTRRLLMQQVEEARAALLTPDAGTKP